MVFSNYNPNSQNNPKQVRTHAHIHGGTQRNTDAHGVWLQDFNWRARVPRRGKDVSKTSRGRGRAMTTYL